MTPANETSEPAPPGALAAAFSARRVLTRPQAVALTVVGSGLVLAAIVSPLSTAVVLIGLATFTYTAAFAYRISVFFSALRSPDLVRVSDGEARHVSDDDLPAYTVLVAAFHEERVMGQLMAAVDRIDYPRDRLQVRVLVEADDLGTTTAAVAASPGAYVEVVRVPPSPTRTKPNALDHGLRDATGTLLTIYDAEDIPEPLQLRRAAAAFRRLPPTVACLQARLAFHNAGQNLITMWFATEYAMWFTQFLPGLVARDAPIPLGGTSNHFRRDVIVAVGGWDPYNVTEDADLGIRLHRLGYRSRILDSVTLEEANSDFVNWVKQRSRWYKGYLQTWLVHMRRPRSLIREIGLPGFVSLNLFVAATPLLALLNPVFWTLMVVWFLGHLAVIQALFPPWIYYLSLFCFAIGNLTCLYSSLLSARETGDPRLVLAAVISPIYWLIMSIAAIKALLQLVAAPSFWEKTVHGLDRPDQRGAEHHAAS